MAEAVALKFKDKTPAESLEERARQYVEQNRFLEEQRSNWETHWQEITDYIVPRRGFYPRAGKKPNEGEKKHSKIINGVATRALRVLAAGMQGGLTSPARPWFKLGLVNDELEDQANVKAWLGQVEKRMYRVFARSNFYDTIHAIYTELAGFGTSSLFEEEHFDKVICFRVLTAGTFCLATDEYGVVNTIFRRFWLTAKQMASKFGEEALSDGIRKVLKRTPYEYYEILHAIQPRDNRDRTKRDNRNMPYESLYLEFRNPKQVLRESGFNEFPCFCPRWDVTGADTYGRSPGMDVLSDVKMLQELEKSNIVALHKRNDPPMRAPSYYKGNIKTFPGGINYFGTGQDPGGLQALYEVDPDVDKTQAKIEKVEMAIREGLYNDLFLMILERPNMTATEVVERHEEKMLMLGPVIERQTHELLDPCIDRTFNIMIRRGMIPTPPEEIQGQELRVEYISLLAQAQKLVATQSIQGFTGFVTDLAVATQNPEIWDKVDTDKAIEAFHDSVGAPAELLRADEEVVAIREGRRKAILEEQARQREERNIASMRELSQTPTGEEGGQTALSDLKRTLEGGGLVQ